MLERWREKEIVGVRIAGAACIEEKPSFYLEMAAIQMCGISNISGGCAHHIVGIVNNHVISRTRTYAIKASAHAVVVNSAALPERAPESNSRRRKADTCPPSSAALIGVFASYAVYVINRQIIRL